MCIRDRCNFFTMTAGTRDLLQMQMQMLRDSCLSVRFVFLINININININVTSRDYTPKCFNALKNVLVINLSLIHIDVYKRQL